MLLRTRTHANGTQFGKLAKSYLDSFLFFSIAKTIFAHIPPAFIRFD